MRERGRRSANARGGKMGSRVMRWLTLAVGCAAAVTLVASAWGADSKQSVYIPVAPAFTASQQVESASSDWITAGGGLTDDRYSTLNQINTGNVSQLQVA